MSPSSWVESLRVGTPLAGTGAGVIGADLKGEGSSDSSANGVRAEARDGRATGRAMPILRRHCGYSKAFQDSDEEKMHYQNGQGECSGPGSGGKEEVTVGSCAGLGMAQVGRRSVPTEQTRAPERQDVTGPTPEVSAVRHSRVCRHR